MPIYIYIFSALSLDSFLTPPFLQIKAGAKIETSGR